MSSSNSVFAKKYVYPEAMKQDVVDNYHGTQVADPYRWLEDPDSPETVAWVTKENELTAQYIVSRYFQDRDLSEVTVLATDVGAEKRARNVARLLGTPLAIVNKERIGNEERVVAQTLIGDVEGRQV
jgi:hypothetical protein